MGERRMRAHQLQEGREAALTRTLGKALYLWERALVARETQGMWVWAALLCDQGAPCESGERNGKAMLPGMSSALSLSVC